MRTTGGLARGVPGRLYLPAMSRYFSWVALVLLAVAKAAEHADGEGFFPVVVQVADAVTGDPVAGAEALLENPGKYREVDLDPARLDRVRPRYLGKAVSTDAMGTAVVHYHARWGSWRSGEESGYSRAMKGTLVVKIAGKEVYRKPLAEWAKENGYIPTAASAPSVVVLAR